MWVKSFNKIYQGVRKEDFWRAWADIKNWPKWDKELEYCQTGHDFAFSEGNQFILKPIGGPNIRIRLAEVVENYKFTDYCKFISATMYDAHELEETPKGVRITNTITVTGPLSFLWVRLVAKNVVNSIPKQTDALIKYVSANCG